MRTNKMIFIIVSILLCLTIYSFVSIQQNIPTPTPVSESTRILYLKYCAGCHGQKLERFAARQWVFGSSLKEVSATIKYGRPAIGMPAYTKAMDDEQITAMANYMIQEVAKVPANLPTTFDDKSIIKSENFSFVLQEVVGKNLKIPWGLAFLPNMDLLLTEKSGNMYLVSKKKMIPIEGVPPITVKGQGGANGCSTSSCL